jgi:hypothetical protein
MLGQILTIARNAFIESVRQPIYFVLIALCGILQILLTAGTGFSMGHSSSAEVSADNKLLLDVSLASVFVCALLLAAFVATAVISREIENRTVLTVVSKPVARPAVVIGKYLGVAAAMVIAVATMLLFVQMAIRHGVMSTAADEIDGPVVIFSLAAALIALFVGIWVNFFYGWVFTQTASLLMLPLMAVAWLLVMLIDKEWQLQPLLTDFKPQTTLASLSIVMAVLVFTALAVAASARLGQVMTITVCAGVFLFGLLSNYFLGQRVYLNEPIGRIAQVEPVRPSFEGLAEPGDQYEIVLDFPSNKVTPAPGMPFYYGPSPNGAAMVVNFTTPHDLASRPRLDWYDRAVPQGLAIAETRGPQDKVLIVERVGRGSPMEMIRPPEPEDYVFLEHTQRNLAFAVAWGLVTNVQFFYLVDAVTQNQPIPASHIGLIGLYSAAQIGVFLSLAVILFQKREVG